MKDCSSCKNNPLNDSKLAGKVFEKTPCQACVIEDQRMNRPDENLVEFDEVLHGHLLPDGNSSFSDEEISRVEKFRILRRDLLHSGKLSVFGDRILEMLLEDPVPSVREMSRRLDVCFETIRQKVVRLKRLLSKEYVKKYEKSSQFSVYIERHDVGVSKTVFSGSSVKGENTS